MIYEAPSQMAIMQGEIYGIGNSSDGLVVRRTVNSHLMAIGGETDRTSQVKLYLFF